MLLEVPPEQVTTMEELGRGAFGTVYKSVMRRLPEKMTSSKPKDHSLDSHEGRIVATKVLPGAWIQNMAKRWLTLSTDVSMLNWFTGVTLNRFELFNPIGNKYYIVENSISIPRSVTGWCTLGVQFRCFIFSYVYYDLCMYIPMYIMTSLQKCTLIILKYRRGPPWNRLSDRRFVMNISM